ncbi:hypothetical protein TNCV_1183971 [Trichonephila clavipes]|nr:hypothetical protein TNCV_1183971 [Trichonephila clavipes]
MAVGCQFETRWVHRWWIMEGLSIKKTKKRKRVRELRENPSRTKTGKVPGWLKTARCKRIVPLWHGSSLNSSRAASPLVWLVEGVEKREAPDHPRCPPSKLGWKRAKSCSHLYGAQSYGKRQASLSPLP